MIPKSKKDILFFNFNNLPNDIILLEKIIYKFITESIVFMSNLYELKNNLNNFELNIDLNCIFTLFFNEFKNNKYIIDFLSLKDLNLKFFDIEKYILDTYYMLICSYLIKEFTISTSNNINLYTGFVIICKYIHLENDSLKNYNICEICNKDTCSYLVIDEFDIKKIILENVIVCKKCSNTQYINKFCTLCDFKIKKFKKNIFTICTKEKLYDMFIDNGIIKRKCAKCFNN
tara:strand:- start:13142 stop:13834 length:693 start_codon:yes stop_codon:yes gene_type:complete